MLHFINQGKFQPKSLLSTSLTRDGPTTPLIDTLAAVERRWSTESIKWIYQVVLHLKISLCFQGHNVALAGGDRVTKKQLFPLPSPGAGPVMESIPYAVKHRTVAHTKTFTMVTQRGACLKHDLCGYTVGFIHFFNIKSAPLVAAQEPMAQTE